MTSSVPAASGAGHVGVGWRWNMSQEDSGPPHKRFVSITHVRCHGSYAWDLRSMREVTLVKKLTWQEAAELVKLPQEYVEARHVSDFMGEERAYLWGNKGWICPRFEYKCGFDKDEVIVPGETPPHGVNAALQPGDQIVYLHDGRYELLQVGAYSLGKGQS